MTIHVTHPDPFGEAVHLVLTPIRCLMWPGRSRRSLPSTDWRTAKSVRMPSTAASRVVLPLTFCPRYCRYD